MHAAAQFNEGIIDESHDFERDTRNEAVEDLKIAMESQYEN